MSAYVGPVFFLVHAPYRYDGSDLSQVSLAKANKQKLVKLLNAAGLRGIPVIFSPEVNGMGEQRRNREGTVGYLLDAVKHKPKVIEVCSWNFNQRDLVKSLGKAGVCPTQITFAGMVRGDVRGCVLKWVKITRRAFPSSKITVLEGAYSIMARKACLPKGERLRFVEKLEELKVGRAKKLSYRHFV